MKELLELLLTRLNQIPGIKNVELFNKQLTDPEYENVFYPAVYMEVLNPVTYEAGLDNVQYGTVTFRMHIVNESPNQGTEITIYELKEKVNQYLFKYSPGGFTPLVRLREELDMNHTNLYDYQIEYLTTFTEIIEFEEIDEIVTGVEIHYDLYDDNDEIKIDVIN